MVRFAEKRSRLAASCWRVEVVKGGKGFFRRSLRLTSAARNSSPFTSSRTAVASDSEPRVNAFRSILCSFASKG